MKNCNSKAVEFWFWVTEYSIVKLMAKQIKEKKIRRLYVHCVLNQVKQRLVKIK